MNIRLTNQEDAEILAEIENEDTLFNTINALENITEFVINGIAYKRAGRYLSLDTDDNLIEIYLKIS